MATDTLLERKGARTALIVTAGFRDVLQIGRQERPHLCDWRIRRPEPLAPRRLRFQVRDRVLHTGEVLTPLDETDLQIGCWEAARRRPVPAALQRAPGVARAEHLAAMHPLSGSDSERWRRC